jgi:hypothetical protein
MNSTYHPRSRMYGSHITAVACVVVLLGVLSVLPSTNPARMITMTMSSPSSAATHSSVSIGANEFAAAQASLNPADQVGQSHPEDGPQFPPLREYAAMAWDPATNCVLLFGGSNQSTPSSEGGYPNLNDTWAFSGGAWTRLSPSVSPPATSFAAMAYDPNVSAIVLFGGEIAGTGGYIQVVNTTWEFRGGTWKNVSQSISPSPRLSPSLSDDPSRGGLALFGGLQYFPYGTPNGTGTAEVPESDTWSFVNGVWSNITSSVGTPPHGRYLAGLAYDSNESGDVLFGGWEDLSDSTPTYNDTWVLGSTGWSNVTPSVSPPLAGGMAFAYLSETNSIILYGGWIPSVGGESNSTWSFAAGTWTRLSPATVPPNTFAGTFADDPSDGYGVLLLGHMNTGYTISQETWTFADRNWSLAGTNSSLPPAGGGTMVYDASDQEVVLVPNSGTGFTSGSTHTWVFRGGSWSRLNATVAESTLLVYDAADDYVLGFDTSFSQTSTWKFQGNVWTQLFPLMSPNIGESGGIAYDAHDGYVVYYDYTKGGGNPTTWKWSEGDWTNLSLTIQPDLGRTLGPNSMAYDASDGYVLLVQASNFSCGAPGVYCLLTWAFSDGNWTDLTGRSTVAPPPVLGASIAYDAASQEVLLFGGYCPWGSASCPSYGSNQTWAFHSGQWSELPPAASPIARAFAALTYDSSAGETLMFGGEGFLPYDGGYTEYALADTWSFGNDSWTELIPSLTPTSAAIDIGVPTVLSTITPSSFGPPDFSYTGLPGGCVSADSAAITCVPTEAGSFHITVAIDYSGVAQSAASTDLTVAELPEISAFAASANPVAVNETTTLNAIVSGGTAPWKYAYADLPPGCGTVNASTLSCTPTTAGKYTASVTVTDRYGRAASATLALTVGAGPGETSLGKELAWFATPLGGLLLGLLIVGAIVLSVLLVRGRRMRREGEELIEDMRLAVSDGSYTRNRPP